LALRMISERTLAQTWGWAAAGDATRKAKAAQRKEN
jgi:hypothetical protein